MAQRIVAIDQGNTAMKLFLFDGDALTEKVILDTGDYEGAMNQLGIWEATGAIVCSSGALRENWEKYAEGEKMLILSHDTPLPIEVDYSSPSTLGADRIALAAGAASLSDQDCLVADCGTALTLDIVLGGRFRGGNISPGLALRFRSLHEHTALLPEVEATGRLPYFGDDTESAIRAGVVYGLVYEIVGTMEKVEKEYGCHTLFLSGGNAETLAFLVSGELQSRMPWVEIFLEPDLIAFGLLEIYKVNYDKK